MSPCRRVQQLKGKMGATFMKCVFVLLGASVWVLSSLLWGQFSQQAEGGEDQEDWRLITDIEEDKTTTEASCSLRKTVRKDALFQRSFSFSVPPLQCRRSFSTPMWERLGDQLPPYGWKGLPVEVVRSTLALLNSSRLFPAGSGRCVRCAVVGNGGILRGSKQGKNIDRHDYVFRVNGAVIKGFEEDVGTKISFYGFTTNTMKNALRWYRRDGFSGIPQSRDIKYIFIPSDLRDYTMITAAIQGRTVSSGRDAGDGPWKYFGNKTSESFRILHPDFITYVTNSFLSSPRLTNKKTRYLYMPSTGALMLLTAIHTCDQVSAYGFITSNYASFSDHYYDSVKKPLKFFANHDMQMERRLWDSLHRHRILKLFHRKTAS